MTIIRDKDKSVGTKAAFYVLEPTKLSELHAVQAAKMLFIFSPDFKRKIDDTFR